MGDFGVQQWHQTLDSEVLQDVLLGWAFGLFGWATTKMSGGVLYRNVHHANLQTVKLQTTNNL